MAKQKLLIDALNNILDALSTNGQENGASTYLRQNTGTIQRITSQPA
jgi:hypothetical protein